MIRYFMTVVNDGRAALLDPRECIRIISDMFAAVQRINPIHIVRCEYEKAFLFQVTLETKACYPFG